MRPLLLWVRYDGTDFHGWQIQAPGIRTVQEVLTKALTTVFGQGFRLATSSRTDAGVHALRHPVVLESKVAVPGPGLQRGLNTLLPDDVAIVSYRPVPAGFSSRKFALGKTYCYQVDESRHPDPFHDRHAWRIGQRLDIPAMRRAAHFLVGEHDFNAFRSVHCDSPTTRRILQSIHVERSGRLVRIVVTGNAFLRNMVRVIAGTLVDVGRKRRDPDDMSRVLASKDRSEAGMTAPAKGLVLTDVHYPPELLCHGAHGW